jgi:hypothetical protein
MNCDEWCVTCDMQCWTQKTFSWPFPHSTQLLRLIPLPSSSFISLTIHSRYMRPSLQSSSLSSSQPSLYRSPAIKSIALFAASYPGCGVDQSAEVDVDCPCKLWLTSHTSDAWTFLRVPVGQFAPHASLVTISTTFPQSHILTTIT